MQRFMSGAIALTAVAVLSTTAAAPGSEPGEVSPVSADAPRVQVFLDGTHTLRAEFRSSLIDARQRIVSESTGSVMIKRPGRFRWEYREPTEFLLLADGERIWAYEPDLESVTVRKLDADATGSPAMLLGGAGRLEDGFEIRGRFVAEGIEWFELIPRQAQPDFSTVRIGFDGDEIRLMEWVDRLDQVTRVEFTAVERDPDLADALFSFVPPPGVDVIGHDVGTP